MLDFSVSDRVQAFLDFRGFGFDFDDFRFKAVYNSILFSSSSVLPPRLTRFLLPLFFKCPHINSVNEGMPVTERLNSRSDAGTTLKMALFTLIF